MKTILTKMAKARLAELSEKIKSLTATSTQLVEVTSQVSARPPPLLLYSPVLILTARGLQEEARPR